MRSHARKKIRNKLKSTIFAKQLRLVNLSPTMHSHPQFTSAESDPILTPTEETRTFCSADRQYTARSRSNSLPSFFAGQTQNYRKRSTQHSNNLLISFLVANSLSSATALTTADSSFHMEKDNYFASWDNEADSAVCMDHEESLGQCQCRHCDYREEPLLPPPPLPPPEEGPFVGVPTAGLGDAKESEMSECRDAPDEVDVIATRILSVVAAASKNDHQVAWNI